MKRDILHQAFVIRTIATFSLQYKSVDSCVLHTPRKKLSASGGSFELQRLCRSWIELQDPKLKEVPSNSHGMLFSGSLPLHICILLQNAYKVIN